MISQQNTGFNRIQFHIQMVTLKQLTNYIASIQEKYNVYIYFKGRGDGSVMLRIEDKIIRVGDNNGNDTNI